jgi:hypothetical protein
MPIQQRSRLKGFGQSTNERYLVLDVNDIITEINSGGGGGGQQVLGTSIWANGFTIVGAITEDITLPAGATVNYTGPLSMSGTLTVPTGTTLNIL